MKSFYLVVELSDCVCRIIPDADGFGFDFYDDAADYAFNRQKINPDAIYCIAKAVDRVTELPDHQGYKVEQLPDDV